MDVGIPVPKKPLPSIPVRRNDERRRTLMRVLTPGEAMERMSAETDPEVRQKILEVHQGERQRRGTQTKDTPLPRSSLAVERSTVSDLKSRVAQQLEQAAQRTQQVAEQGSRQEEVVEEEAEEAEEEPQFCEYFNEDDEVIEIDGSKALALWDFTGERETDLSFSRGDVITVIRRYDNGWWEGELEGAIGDFPCNFVELTEYEEEEGAQIDGQGEEEEVVEEEAQGEEEVADSGRVQQLAVAQVEPKRRSLVVRANAVRVRDLPLKTGFLTKQGHRRKNWKVRHFVLQPGRLLYYATAQDHMAGKKPKGAVPLLPSVIVKIAPEMRKSNCFAVEDTTKPFTMYMVAPTGEEMLSWMEGIAAAK